MIIIQSLGYIESLIVGILSLNYRDTSSVPGPDKDTGRGSITVRSQCRTDLLRVVFTISAMALILDGNSEMGAYLSLLLMGCFYSNSNKIMHC